MTVTEILLDPTAQPLDVDAPPNEGQAPPTEVAPAAEPDTALADLAVRIDAIDARLAVVAERVDAHGTRVESGASRLDDVEASGAATSGRLTATETRLDAADARSDSTTSRLDATDGTVRSAGEQIISIGGRLTSVDGRLDALDERLAGLRQHATDHDKALEEISRTIAVEVERHTSDALVNSQHSLQLAVNSIAQLALAMAESSRDITEDVSAESATALLDSFRVDLDAILAQLGFESLDTTVGTAFDPHRHRALKRVPTTEASQDKVITRVIRDGYTSAATGRILLFADVEVGRYQP